jgi:hypothetical protein
LAKTERTNHQAVVTMSHDELQSIYQMARDRNDTKQRRGVRSKRWDGKKTDFEIHYEGLRAEWAVCAWFGVGFDHWLSLHGDKGRPDLRVSCHERELSIEVKYRDKRHYEFALPGPDPRQFQADIGILVLPTGNTRSVWLAGWVSREEFLRHYHLENFGYGKRAAIAQTLMRDIIELEGTVHDFTCRSE